MVKLAEKERDGLEVYVVRHGRPFSNMLPV